MTAYTRWATSRPGLCSLLPGIGHYPMEELADFPALLHDWLREVLRMR